MKVDSIAYTYHGNKNIKSLTPYFEGKIHGPCFSFHKNGSINSIDDYHFGKIRYSQYYFKEKWERESYKDTIGKALIYGGIKLFALHGYDSLGNKHGSAFQYYKNLNIRSKRIYNHGNLDSIYFFNKKGKLTGVAW